MEDDTLFNRLRARFCDGKVDAGRAAKDGAEDSADKDSTSIGAKESANAGAKESADKDSVNQKSASAAGAGFALSESLGEITLQTPSRELLPTLRWLKTAEKFEQLIDVIGVDYSHYPAVAAARFGAVYHLLSLSNNCRLRVRAFCEDDDFPALPSVTSVWQAANWFEREAFDLFGIVFHGHNDLRRILTDYGFIGHPFRKDFPLSGHVEMRYDPKQRRVIYQPVSIEPREITPRIVREESFAKDDGNG